MEFFSFGIEINILSPDACLDTKIEYLCIVEKWAELSELKERVLEVSSRPAPRTGRARQRSGLWTLPRDMDTLKE